MTSNDQTAKAVSGLADGRQPPGLGEVPPALGLPIDLPRPPIPPPLDAHVPVTLPQALSDQLRAFSQREGVSLFVLLLTAFAVSLSRWTGDEVEAIGSVMSIRVRPEFEGVLGLGLTTLALRIDLSGDPTFREALRRASRVVDDGLSNGGMPIGRLGDALSLPRDPSGDPLFKAMLVLEPAPPTVPVGWESDTRPIDPRTMVDLLLQLEDRPQGLTGTMRYPTALFRRTTIESLVGRWQTLLRAAIAGPERPIGDLPVLASGERAALLAARNRVTPTSPFERFGPDQLEQSIGARFARQVADGRDRAAVIEADRTWTYGELDAAADAIATAIGKAGSRPRPRVGSLGRPGATQVAGVLGILKAGGVYVPLDPLFPAHRIASIARDAELDLVLVGDGLDGLAQEALGATIPIIDMDEAARSPSAGPIDRAAADDLAYLLYTSGSTGEPKGIIQNHRNVLHDMRAYTNALHIGRDDRLLLAAKPTFRAGIIDLFAALLNGAALCVADVASVGFLGLKDVIVRQRVTVYHSTPTVFRELVATLGSAERLTDVRAVVLGGEEVRATDFDAFREHFADDGVFVNTLGSTESSMGLQFFADATSTIDRPIVPVGYPVEATEVFLLDPYGRLSDFVGEIAIRSRYVALGYWRRPDLTAAAFSHDATDEGLVTYRTGDLGRRLADGSIEFVGRRDRQVKVRGMRVEVAEIERSLAALPGVGQVAVEARQIDGATQLVAYLEAAASERLTEHDIRVALRVELPEYMVPSAFVWLDRLPRTNSNKIDRRALPAPTAEARAASVVAPRDDLERRLIAIWEQVLSRRPIGVKDDFFDLGGTSLLATRIFDRIWRETSQRVPLSALLEDTTIERLAARMLRGRDDEVDGLIAVQPAGTQLPLFMVPGAGSRILYVRNLAHHLGPDQPLYALHRPPSGDADHRVEDLARRYVAMMQRVQPVGPYHLVGFSFGGAVAFEIAQQLTAAGEQVPFLALIDSRNPAQALPAPGSHRRYATYRIGNQIRVVRRLGWRAGSRYLRLRTEIARERATIGFRDFFEPRLPARLRSMLASDPIPPGEREWMAADGTAYDRYRPLPYPGRIIFLWAEHNQDPVEIFDARRGWAELALGGLDVRRIPGSHLTVLLEPLAATTAATLVEALHAVRAPGAPDVASQPRDRSGEMPTTGDPAVADVPLTGAAPAAIDPPVAGAWP